jgi:hypothetical protein
MLVAVRDGLCREAVPSIIIGRHASDVCDNIQARLLEKGGHVLKLFASPLVPRGASTILENLRFVWSTTANQREGSQQAPSLLTPNETWCRFCCAYCICTLIKTLSCNFLTEIQSNPHFTYQNLQTIRCTFRLLATTSLEFSESEVAIDKIFPCTNAHLPWDGPLTHERGALPDTYVCLDRTAPGPVVGNAPMVVHALDRKRSTTTP